MKNKNWFLDIDVNNQNMVNQEHDFKISLVDKPFNVRLYLLKKIK